jgi:hypothetical protein
MKVLFFIVIIFLLLLVFCNRNKQSFSNNNLSISELTKSLYNGDTLDGYRLADVVFYPDYLTRYGADSTIDHVYKYPNTIGTKYIKKRFPMLQKLKSEKDLEIYKDEYFRLEKYILNNLSSLHVDIDLLNELIDEISLKKEVLHKNTLILHIRVGDVLCKYGDNRARVYAKIGNVEWWNKVAEYIENNVITNVIIIAGTHFKDCLEDSANYLESCKKFLENKNSFLKIKYKVGMSPDETLVFCKNAKHFITTGGGYGFFLGKIVKMNGGNFALNKSDTIRNDRNRVLF